jgi:hypothetical protein
MIDRAGSLGNGLFRANVDEKEKTITVIATPGWRVEIIPGKSGEQIVEEKDPVTRIPSREEGPLARFPGARAFTCKMG